MGWTAEAGAPEYERLPIDTRMVTKMDKLPSSSQNLASSDFKSKWKSIKAYKSGARVLPEEREVYNLVQDMVAQGIDVQPEVLEEYLSSYSPSFANRATSFYSKGLNPKLLVVEEGLNPEDSYVASILKSLESKGLVKYNE